MAASDRRADRRGPRHEADIRDPSARVRGFAAGDACRPRLWEAAPVSEVVCDACGRAPLCGRIVAAQRSRARGSRQRSARTAAARRRQGLSTGVEVDRIVGSPGPDAREPARCALGAHRPSPLRLRGLCAARRGRRALRSQRGGRRFPDLRDAVADGSGAAARPDARPIPRHAGRRATRLALGDLQRVRRGRHRGRASQPRAVLRRALRRRRNP